jgi:hypothetical protein
MNASGQWQPDVRLTNDPANSYTSFNRCIAASGSVVHVVWYDDRDGNPAIYYKRSTDLGVSWGADTRLTNNPYNSAMPSVAVSGPVVHVVWRDYRDGDFEIYYKLSTNAGVNWGADIRLTNSTGNSLNPSVAVSGSVVHVVWQDIRDGNNEIYYKCSTDGGASWGTDTRLTNNFAESANPSVTVSGSLVHVTWRDYRDWNYEIYYKCSTDSGVNWEEDRRLTFDDAISWNPSIAVSGSVVHIVWQDERDDDREIYYMRSTDSGIHWGADTRLTNNISWSLSPSIAVSGSVVHVVWRDYRDGNPEIYFKRSIDAGVNWGTDRRLTNNISDLNLPSVAVSGSVVHVVWYDYRDGNPEIYYKRDTNGNIPTGYQNISTETPSKYSLSQNYPNPFNPTTKIKFAMPKAGDAKVIVYDVMGREVQTLVNEKLQAGTYETSFDGSMLNSGVYFYKMTTDGFTETKRMILIK